jgi:methionyl-tRNA formyltransferase
MRILFFGSAEIGFPILEALISSDADELAGVITQPDRPVGRRLKTAPCPVKKFALERGLPVFSPEKIGSPESLKKICSFKADLFVVVAYGQYIPSSVLDLPPRKSINLHPSLLPKYRGSAPIQWALANGDHETGVSIIYVIDRMDAGDILVQKRVPIRPEADAETLQPVLAQAGAEAMMEAIEQIRCGSEQPVSQNEAEVVEVRKLVKEDGRLDWTLPAVTLHNRIRGFVIWPGCFFEKGSLRVKVFKSRVEEGKGVPGEVLDVSGAGPLIATSSRALRLLELQPAGKRRMDGAAFLRGYPLVCGDHLETS